MKKQKLMEIEDIKNKKLICLDIDDCILPWNKPVFENEKLKLLQNTFEDRMKELKKNVDIIKKFCDEYDYKVFIISSWSSFIMKNLELRKDIEEELKQYWNIIKELPIIGKDPFKDRQLAMDVLLDNNNKIICIDDFDLSSHFEYAGEQFRMVNVFMGLGLEKKLKKLATKMKH